MKAEDRRHLYRAKVRRDECIRRESRSFLSRVFNGAVAPALLHFLEDARLSSSEISSLREVLRREEENERSQQVDKERLVKGAGSKESSGKESSGRERKS
jgi:hypothetical protein